jgi:hypothetical protein
MQYPSCQINSPFTIHTSNATFYHRRKTMLVNHAQRLRDTPFYADFPRTEFENRIFRVRQDGISTSPQGSWGKPGLRYDSLYPLWLPQNVMN